MNIPTISTYSIMTSFANALAADTALNAYSQAQFTKDLTVFVGYNVKNPPRETDCPYIVIFPGEKVEGADENPYQYNLSIGWSVVNEAETTSGKIVSLTGLSQCDAFGQLIIDCINKISTSHPIVSIVYSIEPTEFFPQCVGQMDITINVTRPIGAAITYP